jgi:hypothetical protein
MTPIGPRQSPASLILTGAVLAFILGCMIFVARNRGIWIDEIWTLWMTRHDIPLRAVIDQRWTQDVHPPLFFAVNWLVSPLVGLDIFTRRLLNLIPIASFLAVAAGFGVADRRMRPFAIVLVVLTLGNGLAITYFGEYRSYFTELCAAGSLVTGLYWLAVGEHDFEPARQWPAAIVICATELLALNLHYVGTVILGAVLGVSILDLLRRRHWRWAALLSVTGVIAAMMLGGAFLSEVPYVRAAAPSYWIATNTPRAVLYVIDAMIRGGAENLVADVAALAALVSAFRAGRAGRWPALNFAITFFLGLSAAILLLLVINAFKPVIMPRYLMPLVPLSAGLVAALCAETVFSNRWLLAALLVNATLIAAVEASRPHLRPSRWDGAADKVADIVRRCPDTKVYVADPVFFSRNGNPPGSSPIFAFGYRAVAKAHGFTVNAVDPNNPAPIARPANCPTVFWVEAVFSPRSVDRLTSAPFAAPSGVSRAGATLQWADYQDGRALAYVLSVPPRASGGEASVPPAAPGERRTQ